MLTAIYRLVFKSLLVSGIALSLTANSQAALFGDNEARKAILELREKVDTANKSLLRNVMSLQQQIDALNTSNQALVGENEELKFRLEKLDKELAQLKKNLTAVMPAQVTVDGANFTAAAEETSAYEAALADFKASSFGAAAQKFNSLLGKFPNSGYRSSALFYLGTSYYADGKFKEAVNSFNTLIKENPSFNKAPDALLGIANSQIELQYFTAAKATLNKIIKEYGQTPAADTARQRLKSLP